MTSSSGSSTSSKLVRTFDLASGARMEPGRFFCPIRMATSSNSARLREKRFDANYTDCHELDTHGSDSCRGNTRKFSIADGCRCRQIWPALIARWLDRRRFDKTFKREL